MLKVSITLVLPLSVFAMGENGEIRERPISERLSGQALPLRKGDEILTPAFNSETSLGAFGAEGESPARGRFARKIKWREPREQERSAILTPILKPDGSLAGILKDDSDSSLERSDRKSVSWRGVKLPKDAEEENLSVTPMPEVNFGEIFAVEAAPAPTNSPEEASRKNVGWQKPLVKPERTTGKRKRRNGMSESERTAPLRLPVLGGERFSSGTRLGARLPSVPSELDLTVPDLVLREFSFPPIGGGRGK